MDTLDYEKTQTTIGLMGELEKGFRSGKEKGWLDLETVENRLGLCYREEPIFANF